MSYRSRIIRFEPAADPEDLLANPRNWRVHGHMQREALRSVLTDVGFAAPVVVNERTGHVVDGHMRVEEAMRQHSRIPVLYIDVDERAEMILLAGMDPLSELAMADMQNLQELLKAIEEAPQPEPMTLEEFTGVVEDIGNYTVPSSSPDIPVKPLPAGEVVTRLHDETRGLPPRPLGVGRTVECPDCHKKFTV